MLIRTNLPAYLAETLGVDGASRLTGVPGGPVEVVGSSPALRSALRELAEELETMMHRRLQSE